MNRKKMNGTYENQLYKAIIGFLWICSLFLLGWVFLLSPVDSINGISPFDAEIVVMLGNKYVFKKSQDFN